MAAVRTARPAGLEQEPEGGREVQGASPAGRQKRAGADTTGRGAPTVGRLLSLSLSVAGPHPALCLASSALKLGQTGRHLGDTSHAG